MPQMLRLSQSHWLNLETIVYVEDQGTALELTLNFPAPDEDGNLSPLTLYLLQGESRERLLAWLAYHSTYVAVARQGDGDPFEETTDAPAD